MALTGWAHGASPAYLRYSARLVDTEPWFVSFWGYIGSYAQVHAVGSGGTGNWGSRDAGVQFNGNGWVRDVSDTGTEQNGETTAVCGTNVWFNVCAGFLTTSRRVVYVNGGNKGVNAVGPQTIANSSTFTVGCSPDTTNGAAWPTAGGLAEVSVWGSMTEAQMDSLAAKLYNGGAGGAGGNPLNINNEVGQGWSSNLIAYWIDSNNTITDLANANDLSMTGSITNFATGHPTIEAVSGGPQGSASHILAYKVS